MAHGARFAAARRVADRPPSAAGPASSLKHRFNRRLPPDLYFWRDNHGTEVDLLFEQGAALRAVEIKSGATFSPDWLAAGRRWQRYAGTAAATPMLVYGGNDSCVVDGHPVLAWHRLGADSAASHGAAAPGESDSCGADCRQFGVHRNGCRIAARRFEAITRPALIRLHLLCRAWPPPVVTEEWAFELNEPSARWLLRPVTPPSCHRRLLSAAHRQALGRTGAGPQA